MIRAAKEICDNMMWATSLAGEDNLADAWVMLHAQFEALDHGKQADLDEVVSDLMSLHGTHGTLAAQLVSLVREVNA